MSPSCGSNPFLSCNPTIVSAARLPAPQVPFGSTCPFDCKALSSKVCLRSQEPGYQCWRSPCPGTLWCPCTCCGLLTISAPHFQWAELGVEGWSTQAFYKPLNVFIVEKGAGSWSPCHKPWLESLDTLANYCLLKFFLFLSFPQGVFMVFFFLLKG